MGFDEEGIDATPTETGTPDPVPTPRPQEDASPADGKFLVTTVGGRITVTAPPGGPPVTPMEVQAALDLYTAFRRRNPQLPPDRVHKIIEAVVERLAVAGESALTVDGFQDECTKTAVYPQAGDCLIYPLLGLINEVGEALEVVEKSIYAAEFDATMCLVADLFSCAIQLGKVAGLVKKAYRNHGGVLYGAALAAAVSAAEQLGDCHSELDESLEKWDPENDRVAFSTVRFTRQEQGRFAAEMGDVGWYWMGSLAEAKLRAENVARALLAKLRNRAEKGTLASTGDDESTRPVGGG
jgi:hypothetical protein